MKTYKSIFEEKEFLKENFKVESSLSDAVGTFFERDGILHGTIKVVIRTGRLSNHQKQIKEALDLFCSKLSID
ncbi:MAG TPA: hypothetical protein PLY69_07070 [Bacteroidales bacterium]|nr:hypothetical protein [Bacteroidales bacterium]